jgi:hypothetical protein
MPGPEPLITVREAARLIGVSQQALSRQVATGLVRSHRRGKLKAVRLGEVLADRASNLRCIRSGHQPRNPT